MRAVGRTDTRLTDRDQLVGFLDKLKRSSVGPEGQLAKLDGFSSALKFFQVILLKDRPEMFEKARHTLLLIQGWKTTLQEEADEEETGGPLLPRSVTR